MPQTLVEKIATRYAVGLAAGELVHSGDFVTIRPKHVMTHDNTGAVIPKFKEITKGAGSAGGGAARMNDPHQPVFAIDHDIQNRTPENLGKYAKIEAFANEMGVDFYPAGTGISHQVMVEQGYVAPGAMVVGSDSHSNLYGALAALGTPVGADGCGVDLGDGGDVVAGAAGGEGGAQGKAEARSGGEGRDRRVVRAVQPRRGAESRGGVRQREGRRAGGWRGVPVDGPADVDREHDDGVGGRWRGCSRLTRCSVITCMTGRRTLRAGGGRG